MHSSPFETEVKYPAQPGEEVLKVAAILQSNGSVKDVADHFGVSQGTVRNVKMLKTDIAKYAKAWCDFYHIETYLLEPQKRFTKRQVAAIRASTSTSKSLANRYGVSESTIRMIKTGRTYNGS